MFSHMAWYLFSVRHSHLASSVSGWQLHLCLSSSQNSPSLVTRLYFLPGYWPIRVLLNQYEWQIFTVYKSIIPQQCPSLSLWWGGATSQRHITVSEGANHSCDQILLFRDQEMRAAAHFYLLLRAKNVLSKRSQNHLERHEMEQWDQSQAIVRLQCLPWRLITLGL